MRNNTNSNSMESSFYEDSNGQYVPATTTQAQTSPGNSLKRPATLELNSSKSRKARFNASVTAPPVITSPDLQVLKLVSPELEKIIINSAALPTPTPSSILYPTKVSRRPLGGNGMICTAWGRDESSANVRLRISLTLTLITQVTKSLDFS